MFHMPMSSPMMKRMFGFLSCAAADPTTPGSTAAAISSAKALWIIFCFIFLVLCYLFLFFVIVRDYRRADRFSAVSPGPTLLAFVVVPLAFCFEKLDVCRRQLRAIKS